MKFRIPSTFTDIKKLKNRSNFFINRFKYKRKSKLGKNLEDGRIDLTREEYLGICLRSFSINFIFLFVISTTILAFLKVSLFYLFGLAIAFLFSGMSRGLVKNFWTLLLVIAFSISLFYSNLVNMKYAMF